MNTTDHEPIVTIAYLAALADGKASLKERAELKAAVSRLGVTDLDAVTQRVTTGQARLADVVKLLTDDDSRRLAYETALVVCHADGPANEQETSFLGELRSALGLSPAELGEVEQGAAALAGSPVEVKTGTHPSDSALDQQIQNQAIVTAAVELLPDRLANVVILPLQLRLVYQIGQHYGQALDANQIKDLAGTLGIGAAAQVMERVVRKVVGGVARGLVGGLLGGVTGLAAGAAVTFASTYAWVTSQSSITPRGDGSAAKTCGRYSAVFRTKPRRCSRRSKTRSRPRRPP